MVWMQEGGWKPIEFRQQAGVVSQLSLQIGVHSWAIPPPCATMCCVTLSPILWLVAIKFPGLQGHQAPRNRTRAPALAGAWGQLAPCAQTFEARTAAAEASDRPAQVALAAG
jgi:hypothetical protein